MATHDYFLKNLNKNAISYINQTLPAKDFSIFRCVKSLYCVGPIKEWGNQVILKINNQPVSEKLGGVRPDSVKIGAISIHTYKIPPPRRGKKSDKIF